MKCIAIWSPGLGGRFSGWSFGIPERLHTSRQLLKGGPVGGHFSDQTDRDRDRDAGVEPLMDDREIYPDIKKVRRLIEYRHIIDAVEAEVGKLYQYD